MFVMHMTAAKRKKTNVVASRVLLRGWYLSILDGRGLHKQARVPTGC